MTCELTVDQTGTLVPSLSRRVVHPSRVGAWKSQDVKAVAFLLIRVSQRVRNIAVLGDGVLDGVRRYALTGVAVGLVDDTLATGVCAQPKQTVVQLGDRKRGHTADLVKRALDALKREVCAAHVVPDFNRVSAKQPRLAVVDVDRH